MHTGEHAVASKEPVFTRGFLLTCLASIGVFAGYALLLPVLPLYVLERGGETSTIGVVVAVYWLTSIGLRPLLGRLIDQRGGKVVLSGGLGLMAVCAALYVIVPDIPTLLALRVLHGAAMGAGTAAVWALAASMAPPARLGEAMGYFGMFLSGTFVLGPMAGITLLAMGGPPALFTTMLALALGGLLLGLQLSAPPAPKVAGHRGPAPLVARPALLPGAVVFCMMGTYAPMGAFLPLLAEERGIGTDMVGVFLGLNSAAIFVARILGGKLSDRFGRATAILPGLGMVVAGMLLLSVPASVALFLASSVLHGVGVGLAQAALVALAIDRSPAEHRGVAMATVTGAIDLGIGVMAIPFGYMLVASNMTVTFLMAGAVAFVGLVVFGAAVMRSGRQVQQPSSTLAT